MRILVTNDDGGYSPGAAALGEVAATFGDVRIVAPHVEMSSAGHAITAARPLSYKRTPIKGVEAYRVKRDSGRLLGTVPCLGSLIALTLIAACSEMGGSALNVAYDHADWLAAKKIARYVDLDKSQTAALRMHIDRFHTWHRSHELPVYADLLDQAAERMKRPLQREDIAWMMKNVNERWRIAAVQIANELAPVLITLSVEQRRQLADSLARDNARFTKTHLVPDRSKMVKERTDWLVGHVERWLGDLTPVQRTRLNAVADATPDYPAARVAERRRRQLRFVQLVEQLHDEQAMRPALIALLATPRAGADEPYRSAVARYDRELTQMVLDLDRSLSPQQRATAVSRLRRFAEQARALAAKRA